MRVSDYLNSEKLPQLAIHFLYLAFTLPNFYTKYNRIRHFCGIRPLKRTLLTQQRFMLLYTFPWFFYSPHMRTPHCCFRRKPEALGAGRIHLSIFRKVLHAFRTEPLRSDVERLAVIFELWDYHS
jgi:hypothetical protein